MKLVVCFILFQVTCFGQGHFENVQIKPSRNGGQYSPCEPAIAIHPKNPMIMAAGTVLDDYYYSTNGGKSWTSEKLKSKFGVWGDPVLLFDTTGRIYYFHLANYTKTSWIDRIVCQSASSVEGTFDEGTFPKPNGSKAQDKQWTALDVKTNTIAMTWTQFDKYGSAHPTDSSVILFALTKDQGKTWSEPKRISFFAGDCLDDDNTVEGAVPVYGPNGEIYVAWSGPKGLVFQKSEDGGKTWLPKEWVIQEHHGGWSFDVPGINRANGLPILTCDNSSGPNSGTLYLNWCDQRNGLEDTDVWLSQSKDGGKSWTSPVRVNQDDSKKHQFFTWLTVDQSNGNLYFVYYDRRNHEDTQTDVYVSVSTDGGLTFRDVRISTSPFIPNETVFFGDYLNIAAVNGTIRPIWPRMDNGEISLWVTLIQQDELLKLIEK